MSNQEQMVKLMEETKEVVTVNPKSKTKQGATMLSPREKELEQLKGELSEARESLNQLYEKIKGVMIKDLDHRANDATVALLGQDNVVKMLGDALFKGYTLAREYRLHSPRVSSLEDCISRLEGMSDDDYNDYLIRVCHEVRDTLEGMSDYDYNDYLSSLS